MNDTRLATIDKLIKEKKIDKAQHELSKLGPEFLNNSEYLYLRSKIFYLNKLFYIAIDTLLIALEFEKKEKYYNLLSEIYNLLGNKNLSKLFSDPITQLETSSALKKDLSGIYIKK